MKEQINRLVQISRYSNYIMQQIVQRQASAPEGKLHLEKRNKKVVYYQAFDNNIPRKYLCQSQTSLISALAQKRYDQQAYNAIKARKEVMDKCITKLKEAEEKFNLSKIYDNFPSELKPLIKPIQSFDADYARRWQAVKHEKSNYPMEVVFKTKRGENVRSKSELIIANKLFDAGIPYHYEAAFICNNRIISYPDFLVLNPRTGKEYYWEHFGKMGDPVYLEQAICKIEKYARHGVTSGNKLIATFESAEHPMNTELIDNIIANLLKK